ncbi:MAG: serine/threonine-protein phosphatase, partial [Chloroflexi bacterium]|nr:serine/threonine-protein phosphatase [Chloroflexota bacterium]
ILRKADGRIEILGKTHAGLPIGDPKDGEYVAETGVFEPGDVLVLYTDGMIDALNELGESFGQERLLEVIRKTSGRVTEIGNALVNAIHRFVGARAQTDDICLVILGRNASPSSGEHSLEEARPKPLAGPSE